MRVWSKILLGASLSMVIITSCKKETAEEEGNDNELITTVKLTLTEQGTSNTQIYSWSDIDGPGGMDPVIDDIILKANTLYDAQLEFLDESQGSAVNITEEIEEESDVHRIYYEPAADMGLAIADTDKDANAMPLGLTSRWTATQAEDGIVTITLRHYPNGGKESSDLVNSSKSSTDAEVQFNVAVVAP